MTGIAVPSMEIKVKQTGNRFSSSKRAVTTDSTISKEMLTKETSLKKRKQRYYYTTIIIPLCLMKQLSFKNPSP